MRVANPTQRRCFEVHVALNLSVAKSVSNGCPHIKVVLLTAAPIPEYATKDDDSDSEEVQAEMAAKFDAERTADFIRVAIGYFHLSRTASHVASEWLRQESAVQIRAKTHDSQTVLLLQYHSQPTPRSRII